MTITILISNYNYADFLPRCLDAYLAQTRLPDELVVVDDGSTDASRQILADYASREPRLKVLLQERNLGLWAAIDRGLKAAQGDYVYSAGVDDIPEPFMVENLARLAAAHPQVDVVTTNYYFQVYREDGSSFRYPSGIGLAREARYYSPGEFVEALRRCWLPALGLPMFRREVLLAEFRSDFGWWGDYLDVLRFGFRSGMCHAGEPALAFRVVPNSYGSQGRGNPVRNRELLRHIVRSVFTGPEFAEVAGAFERSGALGLIGFPILTSLCNARDWRLLRHVLRPKVLLVGGHELLKRVLRPLIPGWLLELRRRRRL